MNKVMLIGNLTRDPEVRYTTGEQAQAIARFTLAVNRRVRKGDEQQADFISCTAFGRQGEFAEKWLRKGSSVLIIGRLQTGSYTNREGVKVYTTDVIVEEFEFTRSSASERAENDFKGAGKESHTENAKTQENGFYAVEDEGLPFN